MFVIRLIEKLKILCAVLAQRTDIVVGKELPFVDKAADLAHPALCLFISRFRSLGRFSGLGFDMGEIIFVRHGRLR